jgi:CRP-like cAMP-binding protein
MTPRKDPLQLLLRRLTAHSPLDEDDRRALLALPWSLKTFETQGYIVREGDASTICGVLVAGFAFRQKLTGDGSRQIVSLHVPGDPLDFQNFYLDESDHNVQALTRAEVAVVDCFEMRELIRSHPAIARAILVNTLIDGSIFREWILNVGRRAASTRIAHLLCELGVRLEAQGLADHRSYELPLTQEQLADVVGLTPVHVNRTLKALEASGLIDRNRRKLTFPDWPALRDAGDFNTRYLHLEVQRQSIPAMASAAGTNLR